VTWIYAYPLWLFGPAMVIAAAVLAFLGLYIAYRFGSQRERFTHNDVAGPIVGIFGTADLRRRATPTAV